MSNTAITIPAPPAPAGSGSSWPGLSLWHNKSGFGFHDLLDTINPLQHIPIIGTLYRSITGDRPGALSEIAGDGLFGGVFGLIGGLVNVLVQAESGKDIGDHVLATLGLDGNGGSSSGGTTSTVAAAPAGRGFGKAPMPLSPTRYLLPGAGGTAAAPAPQTPTGPTLSSHPIPLQTIGLLLPNQRPRPLIATPPAPGAASGATAAAPTGPSVTGSTALPASVPAGPQTASTPGKPATAKRAAGAAPTGANPTPMPPPGTPIDIPQKMSDALDKYARLLKRREREQTAGDRVDVMQ